MGLGWNLLAIIKKFIGNNLMETGQKETCPNCKEKEVILAAEIEINGKKKKVCQECWQGYCLESEEQKKP